MSALRGGQCPARRPPAARCRGGGGGAGVGNDLPVQDLDLLDGLNQAGTTIMVVTHDQAVAARMRRQVRVLDGQIISDTGGGRAARRPLARPVRGEPS